MCSRSGLEAGHRSADPIAGWAGRGRSRRPSGFGARLGGSVGFDGNSRGLEGGRD
jgi:hypothetical protein